MSRLVGLSYWISGKLYLSLTNQCNAVPIHILRGPSFSLPQCPPLLHEPSPEDIAHAVDEAFEANKINVCYSITCLLRYGSQVLRICRYPPRRVMRSPLPD